MGLDCSHDAWHGAYSAFDRFRRTLTEAAGYKLVSDGGTSGSMVADIDWDSFTEDNLMGKWERLPEDPLLLLIVHSDCDGELSPDACYWLSERLERLLPDLSDEDVLGHIGNMRRKTETFIRGLRDAHAANEPLTFG